MNPEKLTAGPAPRTCAAAALTLALLCAGAEGGTPSGAQALKQARKMMAAARREYLTDHRCPFSVVGAVTRTGSDPDKLAAFVRESIAYEPYAGSVRGPEGTLAARAGSDWDRALLLRAMLAEAGWNSELAVAARSKKERLAVVDAFLAKSGRGRTLGAGSRPDLSKLPPPSPLLARHGIEMKNRRLRISGAVARWQRMLDEAFDAGWAGAAQIRPALGVEAGPLSLAAWRERLAAGAAERVLLYLPQKKSYLDVSPDARAGGEKGARRLEKVPADRVAAFELRLVMRVLDAEKKVKALPVLKHGAPLASLLGRNLRLQVVPEAGRAPGKEMAEWKPAELHDFLVGCDRFQALLSSGEFWKASLVFDRSGRLYTVSSDGRIEAAKGLGKSLGKAFGGMFGGGEKEKPNTGLESLELEIDLKLPGGRTVAVRRLLYGKLRKDVSPIVHFDIAVFPGPVGPETVQWIALDAATRNFDVVADVLSGGNPDRHMRSGKVRVVQRMLNEWQLARLGLADRVMSSAKDLAYLGGPAVVMKTATMTPVPEPKGVARRTVIDVAYDGQRLVPRRAAAARGAFDANVLLGAACTAFEAQLIREKRAGSDVRGACGEFQGAAVMGRKPVAATAARLGAVEPTPLARWGIAANQRDEILVFPGADSPRTWWSVEPGSGATLGRGDGGEGMSATEYLNVIKVNLSNLKCMVAFMGDVIKGTKKNDAMKSWLMCVTGTDNPGNYVGAYGGIASSSMTAGSGFSTAGDVIGGAWDVAGLASSK
ncbi:MAG: hypothetical protein ACYTGB_10980 [Planctomycetota bacterium]|jgi:hypothetical protein